MTWSPATKYRNMSEPHPCLLQCRVPKTKPWHRIYALTTNTLTFTSSTTITPSDSSQDLLTSPSKWKHHSESEIPPCLANACRNGKNHNVQWPPTLLFYLTTTFRCNFYNSISVPSNRHALGCNYCSQRKTKIVTATLKNIGHHAQSKIKISCPFAYSTTLLLNIALHAKLRVTEPVMPSMHLEGHVAWTFDHVTRHKSWFRTKTWNYLLPCHVTQQQGIFQTHNQLKSDHTSCHVVHTHCP